MRTCRGEKCMGINQISSMSSSNPSSPKGGKSPTSTFSGFTKAPLFSGQVKYLCPPTVPSFLPVGSSSSIPTHIGAKSSETVDEIDLGNWDGIVGTGPTNLITPLRICGGLDGSIIARFDTSISLRCQCVSVYLLCRSENRTWSIKRREWGMGSANSIYVIFLREKN